MLKLSESWLQGYVNQCDTVVPRQVQMPPLPGVYRPCAVIATDYWEAYKAVLPRNRHHAVGKATGLTSEIERFNNTLRQRVSRLGRKTLSFAKKLENHLAAIWNLIHYYNEQMRLEPVSC